VGKDKNSRSKKYRSCQQPDVENRSQRLDFFQKNSYNALGGAAIPKWGYHGLMPTTVQSSPIGLDNLCGISSDNLFGAELGCDWALGVVSQCEAGEMMGIPVEKVSFAEVNAAWEGADKDKAKAIAQRWKEDATDVIGVSDETLETSAAMYLGMKAVLRRHGANAIAVNCLSGFYGGHIHAYPCLGFHQLNNDGLVGACECDLRSTATMLMISALTGGRPSFISDPVIDTAKRQIIYAHCVAPNRMFGPDGPANPFVIMTHSEDRQGASVRSILPLG